MRCAAAFALAFRRLCWSWDRLQLNDQRPARRRRWSLRRRDNRLLLPRHRLRRPPRPGPPRASATIPMRSARRARSRSTPPAGRVSASSISGSYDFLRDKEVVLTFDDGPWPGTTPAVSKRSATNASRRSFFTIGKHAIWHPEILRQVASGGHTVGTHTWSHKDLSKNLARISRRPRTRSRKASAR